MSRYFDLTQMSPRFFLTKDIVSSFAEMDVPEQTRLVSFFALNSQLLPQDDLRLFFTLAAAPGAVREHVIKADRLTEYRRYERLGVGAGDTDELQEDFSVSIRHGSKEISSYIARKNPHLLRDRGFVSSLLTDVVADGDLTNLSLLLSYGPHLNSREGVQGQTALESLAQIVFHSVQSLPIPETDFIPDPPFLVPVDEVVPRFAPLLTVLLQHGARPFGLNEGYADISYTYHPSEMNTRPELAFSSLATNRLFSVFSDQLEAAFPGSVDAYNRWSLRVETKTKPCFLKVVSP